MLGAITGDIIGSRFERGKFKSTEFELFTSESSFTDDTVLTVAVADCILHGLDYSKTIRRYGKAYPQAGYGGTFKKWMFGFISGPYNSWGNGWAMRVSPVGWAFYKEEDVLEEAKRSAEVTHNHPEGVKGAQALALAVWLARNGASKRAIQVAVEEKFSYDLRTTLDEIRPHYQFDVSCQGSVPQAIRAFLESENFENAIRLAISIGGDSDTIACMAGAVAEAFYKEIPEKMLVGVKKRLPEPFLKIVEMFYGKYGVDQS